MEKEDEILRVLKEIRAALKVIASEKRDELLKELEVKSPKRKQMFKLFSGKLNLKDIAKKVGTSSQAVQQFVDECRGKGLVELTCPP